MDVRTPPVPQEMKGAPAGTVPALPPDQPRVHSSGSARGDACGGLGRREEEQGERGDATDREVLASAPGLLIQLKGLIPEVPRGESGLSEGTRAGSWEGWASLGITDTTAGAAHCPQLRPAHSLSLGPSQPRVPSSAVTRLGHQPVWPSCVSPALRRDGPLQFWGKWKSLTPVSQGEAGVFSLPRPSALEMGQQSWGRQGRTEEPHHTNGIFGDSHISLLGGCTQHQTLFAGITFSARTTAAGAEQTLSPQSSCTRTMPPVFPREGPGSTSISWGETP